MINASFACIMRHNNLCQNSFYTAVYSNWHYSRIDLDGLKFLRNVSFFEDFKISICVNVRPPESTFLWKAIWYLNFWYFKLYFIFFLQFFQFEIEKWRKLKIWSLFLPSSRQKIFGQWIRNVLIETVNIDFTALDFCKNEI